MSKTASRSHTSGRHCSRRARPHTATGISETRTSEAQDRPWGLGFRGCPASVQSTGRRVREMAC